ncbi:hypothetical protein DS742_02460 [Lacrimispora amygdalina]|uniref:HPt domain-containing protein n=1 Tax=Lacrimispora amygdalina TaxID=253257 RepID=A0A3E2NHR9_9FIRM|nr:Hpt domain-containing protein [Clostridium indicum]RFZ80562.1 hypothetical protein DS742_02460 [Clostridium indicum]
MEQKIVDIKAFQKDVGLDCDTIKELYLVFVEELEHGKHTANMQLCFENFTELMKVVHDIKGIASSYKAQEVYEIAKSLDIKLKSQDYVSINTYVLELNDAIDQVKREILQYFK